MIREEITEEIMALSLWQPWASLMAIGAKRIETRHWSTTYRGLVAIHAAKTSNTDTKSAMQDEQFIARLWPRQSDDLAPLHVLPHGCFIALGRLDRVESTSVHANSIPPIHSDEYDFGNYEPGRFMWVFTDMWKLTEPVDAKGRQNLWKVTGDLRAAIIAALPMEATTIL